MTDNWNTLFLFLSLSPSLSSHLIASADNLLVFSLLRANGKGKRGERGRRGGVEGTHYVRHHTQAHEQQDGHYHVENIVVVQSFDRDDQIDGHQVHSLVRTAARQNWGWIRWRWHLAVVVEEEAELALEREVPRLDFQGFDIPPTDDVPFSSDEESRALRRRNKFLDLIRSFEAKLHDELLRVERESPKVHL